MSGSVVLPWEAVHSGDWDPFSPKLRSVRSHIKVFLVS